MKACITCSVVKPLDQFYEHPMMGDGHLNRCIPCHLAIARARAKSPEAKARAYYRKKLRYERDLPKRVARKAVEIAIYRGDLVRLPCEKCGTDKKIEAHHDDYSKPLAVRWLCQKHHFEHHRLENKARKLKEKSACA